MRLCRQVMTKSLCVHSDSKSTVCKVKSGSRSLSESVSKDPDSDAEGNLRDHVQLEQFVVLTNLESLNAMLACQGLPEPERLLRLNEIAITQMRALLTDPGVKRLK